MKGFSLSQWSVIIILSLLTALEPLSIDLYLPGFIEIGNAFKAPVSDVQLSLSTFLAGFAIGQLLWGPLADKYGRKKPLLVSLVIFAAASIGCLYVPSIEWLWGMRFIQAIGGCAGVVIARAVVTDYFDKNNTLKIFAILALIAGIAPIVAPSIGNAVLRLLQWEGLFEVLAVLGVLAFLLVLFFLPETQTQNVTSRTENTFKVYFSLLHNKRFAIYSLVAGIVNGALMIYVANGPFLIIEKGGFSSDAFSLIFSVNALGLMAASFLTTVLQKRMATNNLVKCAIFMMAVVSVVLLTAMYIQVSMPIILFILFFYIFPIGILFPTTTELALMPFAETNKSGSASALFGSIQLGIAFICTVVANYISDGTVVSVGISLLFCGVLLFAIIFSRIQLAPVTSNHPTT